MECVSVSGESLLYSSCLADVVWLLILGLLFGLWLWCKRVLSFAVWWFLLCWDGLGCGVLVFGVSSLFGSLVVCVLCGKSVFCRFSFFGLGLLFVVFYWLDAVLVFPYSSLCK